MKSQLQKSINPKTLVRYLQTRGWSKSGKLGNGLIIYDAPGDSTLDLLLPPSDSPAFNVYVQDAIEIISFVESSTVNDIERTLKSWSNDSFMVRILDGSNPSLWAAAEIIEQLRLFFSYSATQQISPRPYFSGPLKQASEFTRSCEFAHTEKRSFAFVVEVPIEMQLDIFEMDVDLSLGRNVLERVMGGLSQFEQNETIDFEHGFNANMCETFANLADAIPTTFEVSTQWSSERKPSHLGLSRPVRMNQQILRSMRRAARSLRTKEVTDREEMQGPVMKLRKDIDWLESGALGGMIEVYFRQPGKHSVWLIVHLDEAQHHLAIEAYEQNLEVIFEGRREKSGNRWHVYEPHAFRLAGVVPDLTL